MNALDYRVKFQSFNPLPSRFPNRRVISRETLHIIKELREMGIGVTVLPEDGGELNFVTEKGIKEFLSDPVFATLVNVPISVVCGVIGNFLYGYLSKSSLPQEESHVVLELENNRLKYDHVGKLISDERFHEILRTLEKRTAANEIARLIPSPYPERPLPIYLEHTPQIIGWGNVSVREEGLLVEDAIISDDRTYKRLQSGDLKGFSISGLVRKPVCQICQGSYFDCNHISGRTYDGKVCICRLESVDLLEVSIVKDPVNTQCKVKFYK